MKEIAGIEENMWNNSASFFHKTGTKLSHLRVELFSWLNNLCYLTCHIFWRTIKGSPKIFINNFRWFFNNVIADMWLIVKNVWTPNNWIMPYQFYMRYFHSLHWFRVLLHAVDLSWKWKRLNLSDRLRSIVWKLRH